MFFMIIHLRWDVNNTVPESSKRGRIRLIEGNAKSLCLKKSNPGKYFCRFLNLIINECKCPKVYGLHLGLINFIDNKAKCRYLKKLTCKGTFRQVFIRVHRQSIMMVFSTQLCELLPLQPSLWFKSPPPPFSAYKVYGGGGG
jgi:hypothetical protein